MLGFGNHQSRLNFSVQASEGRGGKHTFRRAASSHDRMNSGADNRCADARGKVAIGNQPDARAGLANILDQLFVARTVQNHYNEILHFAIKALGDGLQVMGNRRVEFDSALAGRSDDDLFHVQIGRVEQAAAFAGGENHDRVGRASRAKIGAFERVHRDVHFRVFMALVSNGRADFFADEEHWRFVAFAFADDDGAVHADAIHGAAKCFHGHLIGLAPIAEAHGAGRRNRSSLYNTQKLQTKRLLHDGS